MVSLWLMGEGRVIFLGELAVKSGVLTGLQTERLDSSSAFSVVFGVELVLEQLRYKRRREAARVKSTATNCTPEPELKGSDGS